MNYENYIKDYNAVKELVVGRLIEEGLISEDDADEFCERCQVLIYKGTWFQRWFKKNMQVCDPNEHFIRIIEMKPKEDKIDRLIRRTTGDYDE